MDASCNICGHDVPKSTDRFKLTSKVTKKDVSIAKLLNDWGVLISKEEEHLLICRVCNRSFVKCIN